MPNIFIHFRQKYKHLINDTKIKSWNCFVTESSRENAWGLAYKIAKNNLNSDKMTEIKSQNGDLMTSAEDIIETLFNTFFPKNDSIVETEVHRNMRQKLIDFNYDSNPIPANNETEFTEEEVTAIIDVQNHKKAPGVDGLTADII